jgi:two-component system, OmpR family, sensor kinase
MSAVTRTRRCSEKRRTTRPMNATGTSPVSREAALQARITELEGELQARDDFLAIAAHELRNPMTPISARLELLLAKTRALRGGVPTGIAQGLEHLEQLVDAYLRRATVLLDVSRITSGNLRLQASEVDLSALLRKVTVNTIPLAERAGCRLQLTVQEEVTGRCDAMALERILENLLSNAVRYGPGRPIDVTFGSDGEMIRLSVRDQGIGIAHSDQAQIFERFHALPRTSPNGGFGVGLWVTRQLVLAMGGEITVSSDLGMGSVFIVKFPLWAGDEIDEH